jgi:hypothetical protein
MPSGRQPGALETALQGKGLRMFDDRPDAHWASEFNELGATRVREKIVGQVWDKEKKRAARRWLEKQDVKAWQARQVSSPTDKPTIRQFLRKHSKWIMVVVGFMLFMMFGWRRMF